MSENQLVVEVRQDSGKGAARRLRASGRIPGICYGSKTATLAVSLDPKHLESLLAASTAGLNTLFELRVQGGSELDGSRVLVRELQRTPVGGKLLHADLYTVDLAQKVHVQVPVHLEGTPEGVKFGGILDHTLREIEFECLATSIPEEIRVDVSSLEIGQSLHVRDLILPAGIDLVSDPELAVVLVAAPAAEEEVVAPEAEVAEGEAAVPVEGEEAAAPADDGKDEKSGE